MEGPAPEAASGVSVQGAAKVQRRQRLRAQWAPRARLPRAGQATRTERAWEDEGGGRVGSRKVRQPRACGACPQTGKEPTTHRENLQKSSMWAGLPRWPQYPLLLVSLSFSMISADFTHFCF